ncbi:MAG: response regulator [Rubrivivax sp.]|nr:MAG: response regulator [Rubrivivax sp.]
MSDVQDTLIDPRTPVAADALWTVLCVDDEPNILSAMRRLFRGTGYRILTAEGGAQALELLGREQVDLIISDMRMPGMDGAELLEKVRQGWPGTTRLLLTGYADVASTIAAINQGQIYRYITKPWSDEEILLTVRQAFERHALEADKRRLEAQVHQQNESLKELNASLETKVAQRTEELSQLNERLKKNYFTSIKTFSNLIELRGGTLVGHARKVADLARKTAQALELPEVDARDVFIAALMHDIGQIGLSDEVLSKSVPKMTPDERTRYRMHPVLGEQALMGLDDMQRVAVLIRSHHERFDGQGYPDGLQGENIAIGARILAVADAFVDLQDGHLGSAGLTQAQAITILSHSRGTQFDPLVLDAFLGLLAKPAATAPAMPLALRTDQLQPGMVLAQDFVSPHGVVLLAADHALTADLIARLRSFEVKHQLNVELKIRPAEEKRA